MRGLDLNFAANLSYLCPRVEDESAARLHYASFESQRDKYKDVGGQAEHH